MVSDKIKKGIRNPRAASSYLKRKGEKRWADTRYEIYRRRKNIPAQKQKIHELITEDEFVLVIMDSCRFDFFRQEYSDYVRGELEIVWSAGNRTPRWTPNTWDGQYDIDYIAGVSYPVSEFAYENKSWDFDPNTTFRETIHLSYRDDLLSTVPPAIITDTALSHFSKSNDIRSVVHYCQPHRPYIGEFKLLPWRVKTENLLETSSSRGFEEKIPEKVHNQSYVMGETLLEFGLTEKEINQLDKERYEVRDRIVDGRLSDEKLREAYRYNLRCVLNEVQRLVEHLRCPVVLSSDHGEHLGEYTEELPRYNHPDQTHPVLREVPWLIVDDSSQGKFNLESAEPNLSDVEKYTDEGSKEEVESNLRALGYV